MTFQVFINLPIADLPRSLAFFKALGFSHNPQFTDDTAACIVISEHIHVMVLTEAKFREFTPKAICDTSKSIEVLNCLSCDSRAEVDDRATRWPLAARSMRNQRTTASCISIALRTPMATAGNSFT